MKYPIRVVVVYKPIEKVNMFDSVLLNKLPFANVLSRSLQSSLAYSTFCIRGKSSFYFLTECITYVARTYGLKNRATLSCT